MCLVLLFFLVPSTSPTNVSVVERRLTSITVKWQPIPENSSNGYLFGYKIRYKKVFGGKYAYLTANWSSGPLIQAKITDLENSTLYEIRIAGYTDEGTGPYSGRITVKTRQCKLLKTKCFALKIQGSIYDRLFLQYNFAPLSKLGKCPASFSVCAMDLLTRMQGNKGIVVLKNH